MPRMKVDESYRARIQGYAERWRNLLAWGAPLPAKIRIDTHKGQNVLGWATPSQCTTVIRCTGRLARDIATVLHELAHLAAPNSEHHGERWRLLFVKAAAEALGCEEYDFDTQVQYLDIDQQVIDMAEIWLEEQ